LNDQVQNVVMQFTNYTIMPQSDVIS